MVQQRISGIGHWWQQRLTAVALVVLIGWLFIALSTVAGGVSSPLHEVAKNWVMRPFNGLCLALMLVMAFWHGYLGLGTIIDDYVHGDALNRVCHRLAWLWCVTFAGLSVVSIGFLYGGG
ncbi:MAG: succinate dehydrogenase, hydrophobic membrane anchor protein [Alphaproteobacteria bacterium GM202ARS2]|nr:succinate dehydrogenase, hydrophobic membrane anchor protein [Alphaproteobacteria bacterium GM202ARS2]